MQSCSHLEKVSITFVFDDTKYIWVLFSLSLTPIQSGIHFGYGWIFVILTVDVVGHIHHHCLRRKSQLSCLDFDNLFHLPPEGHF